MAIQRATFNGNLNPQAQPDETVLDFLQKSRINQAASDQNQQRINLAKAQDTRDQQQFNEEDPIRAAIDLKTLGYVNGQPSQPPQSQQAPQWPSSMQMPAGTSVPSQSPENGPGTLKVPSSIQSAVQPQKPDPFQAYSQAIANKNAVIQSGLDLKAQRLQSQSDPGWAAAVQNPIYKGMYDTSTQNADAIQANKEAQADLPVQQAHVAAVAALKPKLDAILAAHSDEMSKGDYNGMQADLLATVPAALLPDAKEYLTLADKQKPKTEFNINGQNIRAQQAEVGNLRGNNASETKDYDVTKRAALQFKSDYDNYQTQLASGDPQAIKVAQQGMYDKYITGSTNKATGEAQFKNLLGDQGWNTWSQNIIPKIENGSMTTPQVIQAMHDITMNNAETMRQKAQQSNAATEGMASADQSRLGFIDPNSVVVHPDKMLAQDSATFASGKTKPNSKTTATTWVRDATGKLVPQVSK